MPMFSNGWPKVFIIFLCIVWVVDNFLYGADIIVELRDDFLSEPDPSAFLALLLVAAVECCPLYYGLKISLWGTKKIQLLYMAVILGVVIAFTHTIHTVWVREDLLILYQIRRVNEFIEANKDSGKYKDIRVAKATMSGAQRRKMSKRYLLLCGTVKAKEDLEQFREFARKIELRAHYEIEVESISKRKKAGN